MFKKLRSKKQTFSHVRSSSSPEMEFFFVVLNGHFFFYFFQEFKMVNTGLVENSHLDPRIMTSVYIFMVCNPPKEKKMAISTLILSAWKLKKRLQKA